MTSGLSDKVRLCLYIDTENAHNKYLDSLYSYLMNTGRYAKIEVKCYLTSNESEIKQWTKACARIHNSELIINEKVSKHKNSLDIAIVTDIAMMSSTNSDIDEYLIYSADSDYAPLVKRVRENKKKIIGFASSSYAKSYPRLFDEFITIHELNNTESPLLESSSLFAEVIVSVLAIMNCSARAPFDDICYAVSETFNISVKSVASIIKNSDLIRFSNSGRTLYSTTAGVCYTQHLDRQKIMRNMLSKNVSCSSIYDRNYPLLYNRLEDVVNTLMLSLLIEDIIELYVSEKGPVAVTTIGIVVNNFINRKHPGAYISLAKQLMDIGYSSLTDFISYNITNVVIDFRKNHRYVSKRNVNENRIYSNVIPIDNPKVIKRA